MRKYDFTRTIKGTTVNVKVYDEGIDNVYNDDVTVSVTPDNKLFKKIVAETVKPRQLLKINECTEFEKLYGWTLDEILPFAHELENRNGKEIDE